MTVRDRSALDVYKVVRQSKLAQHRQRNGCERLVDLDALNVGKSPFRALQRLPNRGNRSDPKHPGLDGCDTVRNETRERLETVSLRERAIRDDHRGSAAVEPRRIAGSDRAVLAKRGLELREHVERRLGTIRFVDRKDLRALSRLHFD